MSVPNMLHLLSFPQLRHVPAPIVATVTEDSVTITLHSYLRPHLPGGLWERVVSDAQEVLSHSEAINTNRNTRNSAGLNSPAPPSVPVVMESDTVHPDASIPDVELDRILADYGYDVPEGADSSAKRVLVREALDTQASKRVRAGSQA